MDPDAVSDARRRKPQLIDALVTQPAFLHGFQTGLKQLQAVFPSRFGFRFERNPLSAMPIRLGRVNRLLLTAKGRLCTLLAQRLLSAPCHFGVDHLALGACIMSQRHTFDNSSAICVATLEQGVKENVFSIAFHPTAPIFATGRGRDTCLWRLSSDNSSATCVATLEGHRSSVSSVAFHPNTELLATGSRDASVKLWRLSSDFSSATCVATLEGHSSGLVSVAFHPTAPVLATGSQDNTAKLWRLSSDNSSATCVATLEGHSDSVYSVAFHPTAPVLATGSYDTTAKLWR